MKIIILLTLFVFDTSLAKTLYETTDIEYSWEITTEAESTTAEYPTTGYPWQQTTTENYWETTRQDPWYTTTRDPWETTTRDPWYTTTRDPWETTTQGPWYTTTRDPWETTTAIIPTPTPPPGAICQKPGLTCGNCSTVVKCVEREDGLVPTKVGHCLTAEGEFCLDGRCTKEYNANCSRDRFRFNCTGVGVFPDPYDCKVYHYCVQSDNGTVLPPFTYTCKNNYTFNPLTTYCSDKPVGGCRESISVPPCTYAGQSEPLSANPSIYFVCIEDEYYNPHLHGILIPRLFLCPYGKKYNSMYRICI